MQINREQLTTGIAIICGRGGGGGGGACCWLFNGTTT